MTIEQRMPRRRSIVIAGFGHENPVPAASLIGQHLVSGVLTGRDPASREMPADLDTQVANIFAHVRELLDAAGGTTDDIVKVTVWLEEGRYRDRAALNREWIAMFPDAESRPARQVMAARFDGATLVQCDLQAILAEPAD
ncbi:RidA family protein [Microbacterium suwonense]|uniref:Enamine deaminase RidA n=1 Tax=Microbacterium suwonense TaxID=683047 RepID=A0ABM8FWJ3_9MICO|nr:RidA family protein [Microbacterium suwonense]BDZ40084.1 enamine deaminase RidA [Microbacterium suwonense]